jgi:hypothetical protein
MEKKKNIATMMLRIYDSKGPGHQCYLILSRSMIQGSQDSKKTRVQVFAALKQLSDAKVVSDGPSAENLLSGVLAGL